MSVCEFLRWLDEYIRTASPLMQVHLSEVRAKFESLHRWDRGGANAPEQPDTFDHLTQGMRDVWPAELLRTARREDFTQRFLPDRAEVAAIRGREIDAMLERREPNVVRREPNHFEGIDLVDIIREQRDQDIHEARMEEIRHRARGGYQEQRNTAFARVTEAIRVNELDRRIRYADVGATIETTLREADHEVRTQEGD